jgi:hypothetical protein
MNNVKPMPRPTLTVTRRRQHRLDQPFVGQRIGIGYEGIDDHDSLQYFKVGPYRDPAGYDTVIYLDNLARGHSKDEVDPSRP